MAQQLLLRAIKRQVRSYAGDLDAQIRDGVLCLSSVELRPCKLLGGGLCLFGSLGEVNAEWSWARLLTSRFEVSLSDVTIVVRLPPPGEDCLLGTGEPDAEAALRLPSSPSSDAAATEENFVQRLKRRIWDQLKIRVSNVQLRFEFYSGRASGEAAAALGGSACGVVMRECTIAPRQASGPGQAIWQTVSVTDAGAFVEACQRPLADMSTLTKVCWPAEESFVVSGLSPECTAARHAGRRFVDWLGLEVDLRLVSPRVTCSHRNWHDLLSLGAMLLSPEFQSAIIAAAGKEEPREEGSPPAAGRRAEKNARAVNPGAAEPTDDESTLAGEKKAEAQPATWSRWFGRMWQPTSPSAEPERLSQKLPEDVSEQDSSILLKAEEEEEQQPGSSDCLKLSVELWEASAELPDLNLAARASSRVKATVFAKGWDACFEVQDAEVREVQAASDAAEALLLCGRLGEGGPEQQPAMLRLHGEQKEGGPPALALTLAPLTLRLSWPLLRAARDAVDVVRVAADHWRVDLPTAACDGVRAVADQLAFCGEACVGGGELSRGITFGWRAEQVELCVGSDVLPLGSGGLVAHLSACGSLSGEGGVSQLDVDAHLERGDTVQEVLQPLSLEVRVSPELIDVKCNSLRLACPARELRFLLHSDALGLWEEGSQHQPATSRQAAYPVKMSLASASFELLDDANAAEWACSLEEVGLTANFTAESLVCELPGVTLTHPRSGGVLKLAGKADLCLARTLALRKGGIQLDRVEIVELPSGISTLQRCTEPVLDRPSEDAEEAAFVTVLLEGRSVSITTQPLELDISASSQTLRFLLAMQATALALAPDQGAGVVPPHAPSARRQEVDTGGGPPPPAGELSAPWSVRWTQTGPLKLRASATWLPEVSFILAFAGGGLYEGAVYRIDGHAGLSVCSKASASRWIEMGAVSVEAKAAHLSVEIPALRARCPVLEVLSLLRAARSARRREGHAPRGFDVAAGLPTISISIGSAVLHLLDGDTGECCVTGRQCGFSHAAGSISLGAASVEAQIQLRSQLQGCIKVEQPAVTARVQEQEGSKVIASVSSGPIQLLDGEGHMAVALSGFAGQGKVGPFTTPCRLEVDAALQGWAQVDTTQDFLNKCKTCGLYVLDTVQTIWLEDPRVFEARATGLVLRKDGYVLEVKGGSPADIQGVRPGWWLQGTNPPAPRGASASEHLRGCALPVVLLFAGPSQALVADIRVAEFPLTASLRTRWGVELGIERASLTCPRLSLEGWSGMASELPAAIVSFYLKAVQADLPRLVAEAWVAGVRAETLARTALTTVLLQVGGTGAALLGGGVAMAAAASGMGMVRGLSIAAVEGRKQRGDAEGGAYRFGDVTRGLVSLAGRGIAAGGKAALPTRPSQGSAGPAPKGVGDHPALPDRSELGRHTTEPPTLRAARPPPPPPPPPRAAAMPGARSGPERPPASGCPQSRPQPEGRGSHSATAAAPGGAASNGAAPSGGYQFGDITRGIAAQGRRARGGEAQGGYQFGDLTRGLWSKWR